MITTSIQPSNHQLNSVLARALLARQQSSSHQQQQSITTTSQQLPQQSNTALTFNPSTPTVASPSQNVLLCGESIGKQAFPDAKNAALFALLHFRVPIVDFLYWAIAERSFILNQPAKAASSECGAWKFLLLQDNSLTALSDQVSMLKRTALSHMAAAAAAASKHTSKFPSQLASHQYEENQQPAINPTAANLCRYSVGSTLPTAMPSLSTAGDEECSDSFNPPTVSQYNGGSSVINNATGKNYPQNNNSKHLDSRQRAKSEGKKAQASAGKRPRAYATIEPISSEGSHGGHGTHSKETHGTSSRESTAMKENTFPTEASNRNSISGGKSTRGSSRRVPEKEGVIECPECGRKGQSIFDPNNSSADGSVWQYFYCRNAECAKGRSANRYIGWTIRRQRPKQSSYGEK